MNTAIMISLILVVGGWQTTGLARARATEDAWTVGLVWLTALTIMVIMGTGLPVPNPIGLLFRLFGGLSVWLRSF